MHLFHINSNKLKIDMLNYKTWSNFCPNSNKRHAVISSSRCIFSLKLINDPGLLFGMWEYTYGSNGSVYIIVQAPKDENECKFHSFTSFLFHFRIVAPKYTHDLHSTTFCLSLKSDKAHFNLLHFWICICNRVWFYLMSLKNCELQHSSRA